MCVNLLKFEMSKWVNPLDLLYLDFFNAREDGEEGGNELTSYGPQNATTWHWDRYFWQWQWFLCYLTYPGEFSPKIKKKYGFFSSWALFLCFWIFFPWTILAEKTFPCMLAQNQHGSAWILKLCSGKGRVLFFLRPDYKHTCLRRVQELLALNFSPLTLILLVIFPLFFSN